MYSTYSLDVASQLYYIDSMINTHHLSYAQYTEHHMIYLIINVDDPVYQLLSMFIAHQMAF